ncbi:MAG: hypothetical protein LBS20_05540 [Prevotella sp.]|jgi:hypothetical protein|nr:hypothetical protein [Prevotella sp.]
MSFKYCVIGGNPPENRKWLEKIGYRLSMQDGSQLDNEILTAYKTGCYDSYSKFMVDYFLYRNEHINCIGNPALLQAVTAMRDDSDIEQHFTNGDAWLLCTRHSFGDYAYIHTYMDSSQTNGTKPLSKN